MEKPKDIVELLYNIKKRPGVYIGKPSILRLHSFMDGYCCAMVYEGIDFNVGFYYSFIRWLSDKYHIKSSVSYDTILMDALQDDKLAFYAFFTEFEQFLQSCT